MQTYFFLQMIVNLRTTEKVTLYNNLLTITEDETFLVETFLEKEYKTESLDFPFTTPTFDKDAAVWGAKTCYLAAQLILFRQNKVEELDKLFPPFAGEITANAMLSADVCLRFIPKMIFHLKAIDNEDELIPLLEKMLETWHYSAFGCQLILENLNFDVILTNPCLKQLYIDRIIATKNTKLAQLPAIYPLIINQLGMYKKEFWPTLELVKTDE